MITKDNAAQYLPLIQALAEGKTLQLFIGNNWTDMRMPVMLSEPPERFRIKPPEPRRFWVNLYDKTTNLRRAGYAYDSRAEADKNAASDRRACIEVVEVIS
jgi:hypothetical protein